MGYETVLVLKLFLILAKDFRNLFCLDSNFKSIIYFHFTAVDIARPYSPFKSAEESGILHRVYLIGTNSEKGRLSRLGTCV